MDSAKAVRLNEGSSLVLEATNTNIQSEVAIYEKQDPNVLKALEKLIIITTWLVLLLNRTLVITK